MRTSPVWSDIAPDVDGKRQSVWDLCYRPDGSNLVVALGRRLVIFDSETGEVLKQKNAHQSDIYSVSTSRDNQYLASGGHDRTVSVWTYSLAQKYTFTHAESVQCVLFNPVVPNILASCSSVDFAIWSMPSTTLRKIKVSSKILSAAWTADGQYLALGMMNGQVSIRDLNGVEKSSFRLLAPAWSVGFLPPQGDSGDILVVGTWDQKLSFLSMTGETVQKAIELPFNPTHIDVLPHGSTFIVAGSDGKSLLVTREGVLLSAVADVSNISHSALTTKNPTRLRSPPKPWILHSKSRPKSSHVASCTSDGRIIVSNVIFSTVHGLYGDRYAYRENMTDVVIQNLISNRRVRIRCHDFVKKIAVYKGTVAIQHSDRVVIYTTENDNVDSVSTDESVSHSKGMDIASLPESIDALAAPAEVSRQEMLYKVKARIFEKLDCNLLVVTSQHIILCLESRLQLYSFSGVKAREWILDSVIRYIKVVGGPSGREALMVGLKSGAVVRVYIHLPIPTVLFTHSGGGVRCLDLSMSRQRVALVDERGVCSVYDLSTKQRVLEQENANSVAWNSQTEDLLAITGGGQLTLRTPGAPAHSKSMLGFVVGFLGARVFSLRSSSMETIELPLSAIVEGYVHRGELSMAYRIACLGITEADWRNLGSVALKCLDLEVAKAAYLRIKDMVRVELIDHLETRLKRSSDKSSIKDKDKEKDKENEKDESSTTSGEKEKSLISHSPIELECLAQVYAYDGDFITAAKLFFRASNSQLAVEMLSDLQLWDAARVFIQSSGNSKATRSLLFRQGLALEAQGDLAAAASVFSSVGMYTYAVELLAAHSRFSELKSLVRTFPLLSPSSAVAMGTKEAPGASPADSTSLDTILDLPSVDVGRKGVEQAIRTALTVFVRQGDSQAVRELSVLLGDSIPVVKSLAQAGHWGLALEVAAGCDSIYASFGKLHHSSSSSTAAAEDGTAANADSMENDTQNIEEEILSEEAEEERRALYAQCMRTILNATPSTSAVSSNATNITSTPSERGNVVGGFRDLHISAIDRYLLSSGSGQAGPHLVVLMLVRAEVLALAEEHEKAQRLFSLAGSPLLSRIMLSQLIKAALEEDRFFDASALFSRLSSACLAEAEHEVAQYSLPFSKEAAELELSVLPSNNALELGGKVVSSSRHGKGKPTRKMVYGVDFFTNCTSGPLALSLRRAELALQLSKIYASYSHVYESISLPFTLASPEQILSSGKWLCTVLCGHTASGELFDGSVVIGSDGMPRRVKKSAFSSTIMTPTVVVPPGVKLTNVLYSILQQSLFLKAKATSEAVLVPLKQAVVPQLWRSTIDSAAMMLLQNADAIPSNHSLSSTSVVNSPSKGANSQQIEENVDPDTLSTSCYKCGFKLPPVPSFVNTRPLLAASPADTSSILSSFIDPGTSYDITSALMRRHDLEGLSTNSAISKSGRNSYLLAAAVRTGKLSGVSASRSALLCSQLSSTPFHICEERCVNCKSLVVRSALSLDVLPLIEVNPVAPDGSVSSSEEILKALSFNRFMLGGASSSKALEEASEEFQQLLVTAGASALASTSANTVWENNNLNVPLELLSRLHSRSVFVVRTRAYPGADDAFVAPLSPLEKSIMPVRVFTSIVPEVEISYCPGCRSFFNAEEFEFESLKSRGCPCCGFKMK